MSTLSTVLAVILGIVFLAAGIGKLTRREDVVANFERWGFPDTIRDAIGCVEVLAGAMLLVGIAVQSLAVAASLLVIFLMVGALATHARASDPPKLWLPPFVLLGMAFALAVSLLP